MKTHAARQVDSQACISRTIEYRAVLLGTALWLLSSIPAGPATAELRAPVGDAAVCYWNPEFSSDGRYVVWFESNPGAPSGQVWHCAVNPETGAPDPPDCKGFRAFEGKLDGHANFGSDNQGAYYRADLSPIQITADAHDKIDAFPFTFDNRRYLMAGIDHTSTSRLYAEGASHQFRPVETVTPPASELQEPCPAQSHETFELGGTLYTAYQISDCASGNFFTAAGEVWLSTLRTSAQKQWRLSSSGARVNNEPEPLVQSPKAWVFYSSYATGQDPQAACPQLWRVDISPGADFAIQ
jgi:hypothetical protein